MNGILASLDQLCCHGQQRQQRHKHDTNDTGASERLCEAQRTLWRETKVLVQPCAAVVTIEAVARNSAARQLGFHRERQRRLACPRQPCEGREGMACV
jgi:hypothetical protein